MKGRSESRVAAAVACILTGALATPPEGLTATPKLPVPCTNANCGKSASQWVTAGKATPTWGTNSLTINQKTPTTVLNWSSFDIGAGDTVTFKQPAASSVALNRIYEANPSQIFGNLKANGQVYLLNLDGFLFGSTAKVNVGSLLVSSLPLTLSDANLANGILSVDQNALFDATLDPLAPGVGRAYELDASGNPILDASGKPIPVQINVQAGASITSADQGRLFLAGQNVSNSGTLTSPDGQVVLAAGEKVYIQADSDPKLRGLLVEVDAGTTAWNQLNGIAANQVGGTLSAPRGNVTMVGLAVNQDGRISATTAVSANGSIKLEAGYNAAFSGAGQLASTTGGALTIGATSEMDILPDTSGGTSTASDTTNPSVITLLGEQVILKGGSITAPGGQLTVAAGTNPASDVGSVPSGAVDPNARLRIDAGTTINLQGSSTTLPASANIVTGQLRSSELADDPDQRNGALHGLTVYVDARNPPPASLANLSGEIAAVPETIYQKTETGGSASFFSQGDAVFATGASINVSGGATTYTPGVLQTTYLLSSTGQLYPIATASPLLTYVGVVNPTYTQTYTTWGQNESQVIPTPGLAFYQPGYVQGAAAGSVQFVAPTLVLQGALAGKVTNGLYQRTPQTAVKGGTLIIGVNTPGGAIDSAQSVPSMLDYFSPAVSVTTNPYPIAVADGSPLPGPLELQLPASYLTSSGFTQTQIFSNATFTLSQGTALSLPPGSTLSVVAQRIEIGSSITDAGGKLSFENEGAVGVDSTITQRAGVFVDDGVTLDVRGLWTNDFLPAMQGETPLTATWQNGGSILLETQSQDALLSIGNNVSLQASGGAWFQASGTLTPGTGGRIGIIADAPNPALDLGQNLEVDGFGVNGAAGGELDLTAPRIAISTASGPWVTAQQVDDDLNKPGGVLQINSSVFSGFGFQTIDLSASGILAPGASSSSVLTVDAGTSIDAVVSSFYLNSKALATPSESTVAGFAKVSTLPEYQRPAASVELSAIPYPSATSGGAAPGQTLAGDVVIDAGASIRTDAGGEIALSGLGSVLVSGLLQAPGGTVTLQIEAPGALEVGFLPGQRIELLSGGSIDVSGTFVPQPTTLPLSLGTAYAGGTVNLIADRGAVVTDFGSNIALAGITAGEDIPASNGYAHELAATAGGTLNVLSGESISLFGAMEAAGGSGGTSGAAAAGTLDVTLSRQAPFATVVPLYAPTFNEGPLQIEILPSLAGLQPTSPDSNLAVLGAAQIERAGFDGLSLTSDNVVEFSGSQFGGAVSLSLGRQLIINAPAIAAVNGAQASVSAPYVELGYASLLASPSSATATPGSGSLTFKADEMTAIGQLSFQGTSNVTLLSSGDLELQGEATGSGLTAQQGSMTVVGNLTLDAARIYPLTATTFDISAQSVPSTTPSGTATPGVVTIGQTGVDPGTPLSAGGALTISAGSIESTGTVYAPFGTISLEASNQIVLGNGSLTSVSGAGLIFPYGETQSNGAQWYYDPGVGPQPVTGVPARRVSLLAPAITTAPRATINLAGGGDLQAFEWVPGPGGSKDVLNGNPALASTVNGYIPGLYAVIPSVRGGASPLDPQNSQGSPILPGETVYLSASSGLPAGTYTLLPPRYALEPGAFLIQMESGSQYRSTTPGLITKLPDGTPVVAGYLSYGATGLHQTPGYVGFAVYPGSYAQALSQYNLSYASTFFSAAATEAGAPRPTLPADAGSLVLQVTPAAGIASVLDLSGHVISTAASGGLAASVELSAPDLVVGNTSGPVPAGAVSVASSVLDSWQAGSLLLGGCRLADCPSDLAGTFSTPTQGTAIVAGANSVTIGAGSVVTADEVLLVANQSIDVQAGAVLRTPSAVTGTAPKAAPAVESVTLDSTTGGTPGFLSVSDLNWAVPVRAANLAASGAGTVSLDAGATLATRGAVTVDGIGGVVLGGSIKAPGAEWSIGAASIAFVPNGVSADALALDPALVAELDTAGTVRLGSTGSIDFMTSVALGLDAASKTILNSLTLSAASLNNATGTAGMPGDVAVKLGAATLTLEGESGSSGATAVAGPSGATLTLRGGELDLGAGTLAVSGFGSTQATVTGGVIGDAAGVANVGSGSVGSSSGSVGSVIVGGNLTLTAAGVTAAPGVSTAIDVTGALVIDGVKGGVFPTMPGGALALTAASIDVSGTVATPSGLLSLTTTSGDLTLERGALLSAAGTTVAIENQTAATPGGSITLEAAGNLNLNAGSLIDVAGAGAAAAGSLSLNTSGRSVVAAGLVGKGGAFALDTGSLDPSTSLDTLSSLLGTGGFTQAIDVRVRSGNLTLDQGYSLSAGDLTVTADSGSLTIGGTLTATSGALRSTLSVFGGDGIELTGTAVLSAPGAGSSGRGGTIEIGAGHLVVDASGVLDEYNPALIQLDAGSRISAAGAGGDGTVLLRAPALQASNGVGIDVAGGTLGAPIQQVGQIIVEPVLAFNTANLSSATQPTAGDFASIEQNVSNFMAAAVHGITTALAPHGSTPFMVEAGVELVADGDLTLSPGARGAPALDLSSWRFGGSTGTPVDLTIRAAGSLTIAGTVTDGFADQSFGRNVQSVLTPGPSSSIRLVAGADLTSADPLAAASTSEAALTLGVAGSKTPVLVRTGTGDIDLVAAGDIVIANSASGAYTAGVPAIAPGGTAAAPYPTDPAGQLGSDLTVSNAFGSYVAGILISPTSGLVMSFPTGGGDLTVRAGGDIEGILPTQPAVSTWQLREGGGNNLPEWGVNLAAYNWTFGTLGGGDVRITAGGSVSYLTVAAADSLLPQYGGGTAYVTSGGLALHAGGDIGSSQVFLAEGVGTVTAGGGLTAIEPSANNQDTAQVGSAAYLQASSLAITARLGIAFDGVFDPTGFSQNQPATYQALTGSFLSYTSSSTLTLESIAGDVDLNEADHSVQTVLGNKVAGNSTTTAGHAVVPASVTIDALQGNIEFGLGFSGQVLFPAPRGQLDLLASGNIDSLHVASTVYTMSDAIPGTYATVANYSATTPLTAIPTDFAGDLHIGDPNPALVTAGGSIEGIGLSIPKAATIVAGMDILDTVYVGQNLASTDETVLSAGRDVIYDTACTDCNGIEVGGPGGVEVLAGRNVAFGYSRGIITTGNLVNANLSSTRGADITIATGLGSATDIADFLTKIIEPSKTYRGQLVDYVESLLGNAALGYATALAAFEKLPADEQRPFIDKVFFKELLLSGRGAATPGVGYKEGYAAIDTLFPGSRTAGPNFVPSAYQGDLSLTLSQIYTLDGGDISLLVPGGEIDVGLSIVPPSAPPRTASQLGIVTEGPGNIDIYTRGDVNVNSSRIFTLGGGDILIWSDEGSIDAGRGSKTAISAPPPTVSIDSSGNVTINLGSIAEGSGIRTIQTEPTTPAGNVDLIAPLGTVNAGDAGIGAAGNLNVEAIAFVGASNTNVGGTATGLASTPISVSASLSSASSSASGASSTATSSVAGSAAEKESAPLAQAALSWLDVFVTGLGAENCKPDDVECLRRQTKPTH